MDNKDNFGKLMLALSTVLYLLVLILIVAPLPQKLDTFLVASWVFLPAVIGSLIYIRIEKEGRW